MWGFMLVVFQCHHGVPASQHDDRDDCFQDRFQCHHGVPAFIAVAEVMGEKFTFQCHHGVPACSGPQVPSPPGGCFNATTAFLLGVELVADDHTDPVSMPPRRSCLIPFTTFAYVPDAVSMPPRRSCLGRDRRPWSREPGFQCHHGVPALRVGIEAALRLRPVSMPPRRSCLWRSSTCWHSAKSVSMPPRRSCLDLPLCSPTGLARFQCHHGVPAFQTQSSECPPQSGFNATTAFLLGA